MATRDEFDNWFAYHAPSAEQVESYMLVRLQAREFAEKFDGFAPDCADKTAALRKLRETVMAMNLAIACNT